MDNAKTHAEVAKKQKFQHFIGILEAKQEFTKRDIEEEYSKMSPTRECSIESIVFMKLFLKPKSNKSSLAFSSNCLIR